MGLFGALVGVASMPLRAAVDVVKLPGKVLNGEGGLLENTGKGIEHIEEELDD